jgi:hypothetical protein
MGHPVWRRTAGAPTASRNEPDRSLGGWSHPVGPGGLTWINEPGVARGRDRVRLPLAADDSRGCARRSNLTQEKGARAGPLFAGDAACYTRRLYSPVRVSISIESPVLTNSGTSTSKLPTFAGFITFPDVSPLTAGSV